MALSKVTVIDKVEFLGDTGHIQVREAIRVMEDGEILSQKFHRYVVEPDADITDQPALIKNIHGAAVSAEHIDKAKLRKKKEMRDALKDQAAREADTTV